MTDSQQDNQELSTKQRLNQETAKISWKELELFFAKGNLLCVSKGEDLVTTAEQIIHNEKDKIENLIKKDKITFATPEWVTQNCQPETQLWAVVVAPYVLCQLRS